MKINKIATLILLMMVGFITSSQAQFQGQITMKVYGDNNGVRNENELNMYVTPERIFIKGEEELNFGQPVSSDGLLIRNDKKDFILMLEENDALQVRKSEIEGLVKMFSGASGSDKDSGTKISYEYTDRKKNVNGREAYELLIRSSESSSTTSVWLTPNVDVNWGMLTQPWGNLPADAEFAVNRILKNEIFESRNFPVLVEVTGKKGTEKVMEVTNIQESNIAKAMVEVPSGVNLIGIFEFMIKMGSAN